MRILIINDFTNSVGGAEIYTHRVAELLEARGHTVDFVGGEEITNPYRQYLQRLYSFKNQEKILNKARKFDPDVVFAQSILFNLSPSFLPKLSSMGIPVVLVVHELNGLSYRKYPNLSSSEIVASLIRKLLHRYLIKRYVDIFVAPSKTVMNHLQEEIGVENVTFVPNPIFWDIHRETALDSNQVIYVGRLDEKKGVDVLIRAYALIANEVDVDLKIIGKGETEELLKELAARLNVEGEIEFIGHIDHEEIKEMFRRSAVFVLPSRIEENCPLTILEAMSQSTPIITTNIGGQRELVKDGDLGLLVPPDDEQALGDALKDLLINHNLREKLARNAVDQAVQFHSKEAHIDRLEQIFHSLISIE